MMLRTIPSAIEVLLPMRNSPAPGSERCSISLTPCCNSPKAATPRLSNAWPYSVGSTPCGPRSRSRAPTACSRSAIDLETADWVVFSSVAALLMLPACATASSTLRSCSFNRRPMRSLTCILAPIATLLWGYRQLAFLGHGCIHYLRHHQAMQMIKTHIEAPEGPPCSLRDVNLLVWQALALLRWLPAWQRLRHIRRGRYV